MDIWIGSLLEGAQQARGAVAIIDVFRAFTTAAVVLANGASRIIMVGDVTEAMKLRNDGLGQVCIGEVGGRAPPGFDFGNSPFEVSDTNFAGKAVIQRTSAGTQGIVAAARHAQVLYAASLVTATATARALLSHRADRIALVAMGSEGIARSDEDELCALHLRNLLEGRPGNPAAVREVILAGGDVLRFHDPSRPYLNRHDLEIALDIDRYDFAIRVTMENGLPVARREK
ncbi:MAG: 2-phosphosulfolactate phosphatase [Rhodoplanes sp.]